MRFNGVNIALFLDDGWTVSPVRSELLIFGLKSGFITNDEKSQMVSESSSRGMVGDYMEHLLMASLPFLSDG